MTTPGPSYLPLDAGLYQIPFGEVLYRPVGYGGGFKLFGDVDSFTLNVNPTRKQRYAKNQHVSTLAIEATTRIDCEVAFKCMQPSDFVRAASLLGTSVPLVQSAGPVTEPIANMVAGDMYWAGAYSITAATMQYTNGQGLTAVPANLVKLVDPQLGLVQLLGLPADAVEDQNGNCAGSVTGTAVAVTAAQDLFNVQIGTVNQVSLEIIVRNLSDIGDASVLWIKQANLAADGAVNFITANEDFEGLMVKGRAAVTAAGVGFYQKLAKPGTY